MGMGSHHEGRLVEVGVAAGRVRMSACPPKGSKGCEVLLLLCHTWQRWEPAGQCGGRGALGDLLSSQEQDRCIQWGFIGLYGGSLKHT